MPFKGRVSFYLFIMSKIKNDFLSSAKSTLPPPDCNSLTAALSHESPWKKITKYLLFCSWNTAAAGAHQTCQQSEKIQLKMFVVSKG